MFPNCIDRFGRQEKKIKKNKTKKNTHTHNKKNKEKPKKKKNENNSTYHEPLSEEWIARRS